MESLTRKQTFCVREEATVIYVDTTFSHLGQVLRSSFYLLQTQIPHTLITCIYFDCFDIC
jgi:hypothetical protein